MRPIAIHQFTPAVSLGDGVSNGVLFTQKILRDLGFESEVFSGYIPPEMAGLALPIRDYPRDAAHGANQLLFVHHCIGIDLEEFVLSIPSPKVMIYHNITPAEQFPLHSPARFYCRLGREQLAAWPKHFIGAIAVSELNAEELNASGYAPVSVIPLLFDMEQFARAPWDRGLPEGIPRGTHLLFVGRIAENKRQHLLIDMLHALRELLPERSLHLHLVGGVSSPEYHEKLLASIAQLKLDGHVHLPGKVSDEVLRSYYRAADTFVCMSEHEGFGIPLIESMILDLPVIACATSNIPNTLGEGGILLPDADPARMACAVRDVLLGPGPRIRLREAQRRNIERFRPQHLQHDLIEFFAGLGYDLSPALTPPPPPTSSELDLLIEGPFDSSYSLAEVNRQCTLALAALPLNIGLHSTEGPGDFPPNPAFLAANPEVAALWQAGEAGEHSHTVLRNLYPPRVSDIQGVLRGMLAYGWEESEFPPLWVDEFNRRLELITVMSSYVERSLIDCGVRVPIVNVGLGADHILSHAAQAPDDDADTAPNRLLGHGFRFLHISSALPRKGVDSLLEAYARAFQQNDDVSLVIKTHPNPHHDIEAELHAWREKYPNAAPVMLINRDLDAAQIRWLYDNCHALVAPSRGEGFGLPIAEAMLLGLPVITTAHGGQLDFCDHDTAWLVDFRYARAHTHFKLYGSVWAEPDTDDLARQMSAVFDTTPEASARRVHVARERIRKNVTWAHTARRIQQAIEQACQHTPSAATPRIGWVSSYNSACGIAEYSRYLLQNWPAGTLPADFRIYANIDAEAKPPDPENLRRVWSTKLRDTSLAGLEQALIEDAVQVLVIQFNFGFFELHSLAGMIERLHARGVRIAITLHSTADVMQDGVLHCLRDIAPSLARCERLYVHGIDDLNRLKDFGLSAQATRLPHGVHVGTALAAKDLASGLSPSQASSPVRSGLGHECPIAHPALEPALGANAILLASFGFLIPHKGLAELIQAFAHLHREIPTLRLLMLNSLHPDPISDVERQRLLALIDELELRHAIELRSDYLDERDILQQLGRTRLIVFPYQKTQESSSAAVRLGLASGAPVACTPLPIFDDLEDAVYRLPATDIESMAHGIRAHLALDAEALEQQAARQQNWLDAHAWPRVAQRIAAWIEQGKNSVGRISAAHPASHTTLADALRLSSQPKPTMPTA
jgi:glycosyltransferase involved in cell wall biosynthesis